MGEMVNVEQCDREAAASAYFAWISNNPVIPEKMRAGEADNHSMVQAFATHRLHQHAGAVDPLLPEFLVEIDRLERSAAVTPSTEERRSASVNH